MKPTQEQILQWAREAGLHLATDVHWMPVIGLEYLEKATALAYEAGRKDENEACAQIAFNAKTYIEAAAAIRARREQ